VPLIRAARQQETKIPQQEIGEGAEAGVRGGKGYPT